MMSCPTCGRPTTSATGCSCQENLTVPLETADVQTALRQLAVDDLRRQAGANDRRFSSLAITEGSLAGTSIGLNDDLLRIGRDPSNDVLLDDVTVSRHHAELRRLGTAYHVVDIGSVNGTYVNSRRVDDTELHDGDELQVGRFKMTFFDGGEKGRLEPE